MFEIGGSLREARLKRGLTPADVQKAIRIRDRYLQALEEERWEVLPGDAYVKGFLRTYADYLGLDGNLYVDEYNNRFAHDEELAFVPERLARSGSRLGGGGLLRPMIAIGAIVAIAIAKSTHRDAAPKVVVATPPAHTVVVVPPPASTYQPLKPVSIDDLPKATASVTAAATATAKPVVNVVRPAGGTAGKKHRGDYGF
jgi:cytoskeletal protein RodZ